LYKRGKGKGCFIEEENREVKNRLLERGKRPSIIATEDLRHRGPVERRALLGGKS